MNTKQKEFLLQGYDFQYIKIGNVELYYNSYDFYMTYLKHPNTKKSKIKSFCESGLDLYNCDIEDVSATLKVN